MIYRSNPINVSNIRRGWVLASRLVRVRLDGEAVREAISLDVPSFAVADPHGIALSPNQERIVVTASGTHELLVYRVGDLPFVGAGGPGDLIDRRLINDTDLFYRIRLDGRPMGVIMDQDQLAYVANDTRNSIQVVDLKKQRVVQEFELGGEYSRTASLRKQSLVGRSFMMDVAALISGTVATPAITTAASTIAQWIR